MNLLTKMFKKRNYKLLLYGGGMLFNYKNKQYYIGSESYITLFKTEVVINRNDIRRVINGNYLNLEDEGQIQIEEKKIILDSLISELEAFGCNVTCF